MKKFAWILCFTLLLGLLAGCQAEPAGTQPSGGTTQPTGTAEPSGTTVPQVTEPVDIRPLPPKNPGNSLIDYDPDRQIYIASENVYMDHYVGVSGFWDFYFKIYSRQKLDPEKISVTFPVDMPFEVDVYEYVAMRKPQIMLNDLDDADYFSGDFPYYLYLAYRGETFVEGWDVSAFDLRQGSIHYLYEGEEIEPRYRDFMSLTEEDLPEFYVYTVSVLLPFPYITELQETVVLDKLDVTIGDEVYEAKLGRVRMLPRDAFPSDTHVVDHDSVRINTGQLYNDGIILLCDVFDLTDIFDMEAVPEDITITGLRIVEEATQILDINVSMNSGGQYMEMQWDGVSPIYLYKGDSISIDVTARNEYAGKLLNYVVSHVVVEYTNSANEQLCFVSSQQCTGSPINYEYYAIIFDGVDMEPYYRNYYYQYAAPWVDEYRGK